MWELDGQRQLEMRADMMAERHRAALAEAATQRALRDARAETHQTATEGTARGRMMLAHALLSVKRIAIRILMSLQ